MTISWRLVFTVTSYRKQKIMILGAGVCQVPIIRKASQMGLTTIVASIDGDYPGFDEADIPLRINVVDRERILEKAARYEVDAVITNQTDLPVTTAAYVAEKLGLPGIGLACAEKFTNKILIRNIATQCGSKAVGCYQVNSSDEAEKMAKTMTLPIIVKPIANQGSRGVTLVESFAELPDAFAGTQRFAPPGGVVIEEYFPGREVKMDGLMHEGRFQNLPLSDVGMFDIPNVFIPKTTYYPSTLDPALQQNVFDLNSRVVAAMGLPFGLTHSEFRVNEETGEVFLIEIAARGGGTLISSDLVPLACGLDVETILLQQALGCPPKSIPQQERRASGYYCGGGFPEGIVKRICSIEEVERLPGVHRIVSSMKVGDRTPALTDKATRAIVFLLKGEARQDIDAIAKKIRETVSVVIDTAKGRVDIHV